jgi:hypothetical protein
MEAAVAKALPKTQADLLQKRLKEADEMEANNRELHAQAKKDEKQILKLTEDNRELLKHQKESVELRDLVKAREEAVTKRELDCEAKERNHEMDKLKIRLEMSERGRADIFNLTDSVFRNRTVQTSVHTNSYSPMTHSGNYDANGAPIMVPSGDTHMYETSKEVIVEDPANRPSDMNPPKTEE